MLEKFFGKSKEKYPILGFGAWGLGQDMWKGTTDSEAKNTLHKAIDEGIMIFDSAHAYGSGHSEILLGQVEKEVDKDLFFTSKIPSKLREWPAKDTSLLKDSFPKDYIIQITEESLRHYKRDFIDLQQFHVWNDNWADQDEWKEAVMKLRDQGKIRLFGLSLNDHQPGNGIKAVESGMVDSVQVIFNIFDQSPIDELFPACIQNNVAVIARVPFDEGALTGAITPETKFLAGDWRENYFRDDRKQQVWDRVQKIKEETSNECETIAEVALRFTISFDAITVVIPGMRKEKNLMANITSIKNGVLSPSLVEKLKAHRWERNFYK